MCNIGKKMRKLIYIGIILIVAFSLSGCLGCMIKGIGAYECGRITDRTEGIEFRKNKLNKLNTNFNIAHLGHKMPMFEKLGIEKRFCMKYKDKKLPISRNLAKDFNIHLGDYYKHKFCSFYYKKPKLQMYEKETKLNDRDGYIYYYLADKKSVYAFWGVNISYTKEGYKYGISNYK